LAVPTIGIGAGRHCSGQILVSDDIFGKFSDFTPKFARKYGNLHLLIKKLCRAIRQRRQNSKFPSEEEIFKLSEEELRQLELHAINKIL